MNPEDRPLLVGTCTEACEQTFSWLGRSHFTPLHEFIWLPNAVHCRYKHATKHMNQESFEFFHLRVADLHNKWLIVKARKEPPRGNNAESDL